jgi:hypothetical protein
MADWYYAKDGERHGPVTSAQLRQMAQSGELQPNDMVFKEGGTQWIVASSVNNLFPGGGVSARPSSGSARPERGRDRDRDEGSLDFDDGDDDRGPIRRPPRTGGSAFMDVLMFRRMIAPILIIVLFWIGVVGVIGYGLFSAGGSVYLLGARGLIVAVIALVSIPFGILAIRLYAEVVILLFRIHEVLVEIKELTRKQQRDKS